jgi:uncharacterized protein (DUF305 family)
MTRMLRLCGAAVLVVTIAACGDDDDTASTATPLTPATSDAQPEATPSDSSSGEFNAADVEFSKAMIVHHGQAIEMAELALEGASGESASVVAIADAVKDAQQPEIELIAGWLQDWGEPTQMTVSHDDHPVSMDGMLSDEQMEALDAASGAAFDSLWLEAMIEHHTGAVEMAETVQADGVNDDVATLAEQIILNQSAEITEMEKLLAE